MDRELGSQDDYAKRAYEAMTLHILAKGEASWNHWIALRLSDGQVDNALYPTREDAINHQLHPTQSCYIVIPPGGNISQKEIKDFLDLSRDLYDKGARIPSHGDYGKRGFRL